MCSEVPSHIWLVARSLPRKRPRQVQRKAVVPGIVIALELGGGGGRGDSAAVLPGLNLGNNLYYICLAFLSSF